MISAPLHPREDERILALKSYKILDTLPEDNFNEIVALASEICNTPISLISLIDESRQWFKAKVGLDASETIRSVAFCSHTILQDDIFIIEDSALDQRFFDNPLFTKAPNVRFYAGVPLINKDGLPLGTLCAIDNQPRQLTPTQINTLKTLAHQVIAQMELRNHIRIQKEYLQQLEQLNQDKDRLFSIISHDLRTPFNGLMGLTDYLATEIDELSKQEITTLSLDLKQSAQAAYGLVDNLLNWALSESGHIRTQLEIISIQPLFDEILHTLLPFAEQKKVQLEIPILHDQQIQADRNMLRSILLNLCSNALKFTPSGGTVTLNFKNRDHYTFSVCDTGLGMNPKEIEKLKQQSTCQSTKGTNGESGTGLGLRLCQDFLNRMGSQLEISSTIGQGSCFNFSLPKIT